MLARMKNRLIAAGLVALSAAWATPATAQYLSDNQKHPGRSWRVQKTTIGGWGDTDVSKSVAGHVVNYAIRRYGLDTVITDPAEIARAKKDMYDFLSWKYGNPSLVAAQWISAGYKHFDGHVAEAAMSLLGTDLEGPGKVVRLDPALSAYLKHEVEQMAGSDTASVCASLSAGSGSSGNSTSGYPGGGQPSPVGYPSTTGNGNGGSGGGVVLGVTCRVLVRIAAEFAKLAIDRLGISSDLLEGKDRFNWKDGDVALTLYVRRNPQLYAGSASRTAKESGRQRTLQPATAQPRTRMPRPER
jgi:hypothetical protein